LKKPISRPNEQIKLRIAFSDGGRGGNYEDSRIRHVGLEIREGEQVIGTASFFVFDGDGSLDDGVSLFEMYDNYSQATYDCGEVVFGPAWNYFNRSVRRLFPQPPGSLNVLLLDRIEVTERFRGKRVGLIVLLRIMRRWGKRCALAVMKPFPLQYERVEEIDAKAFGRDLRRLIRYYSPLGFKRIGGSEYFALSLVHSLPSEKRLLEKEYAAGHDDEVAVSSAEVATVYP
jgi:hypothetical protein